jgi:hypothetical protein
MNYLSLNGYIWPVKLLILILYIISLTNKSHNVYLFVCVIVWQVINQIITIVSMFNRELLFVNAIHRAAII